MLGMVNFLTLLGNAILHQHGPTSQTMNPAGITPEGDHIANTALELKDIYTDLLTFKHMHIMMSFDFPLLPAEITGLHTFPQTPAPPGECGPVMKQILLNLGDGSSGLPRCLFNMFFLLKWGTIRAKPNNFTYLLFTAFLVERAWENDDPPLDFEVFGRLLGAQRWWKSFSANHINHSHCRGSVLTNGHQHQQQHLQTIMCLGNSL